MPDSAAPGATHLVRSPLGALTHGIAELLDGVRTFLVGGTPGKTLQS
jgi:hypothetical protein